MRKLSEIIQIDQCNHRILIRERERQQRIREGNAMTEAEARMMITLRKGLGAEECRPPLEAGEARK